MPKKVWRILPLVVLIVIAVFLYRGLSLDPKALPSVLINKPAPQMGEVNHKMLGKVWLLNVWGSWCQACQVEHPMILELAEDGVKFVGLDYRDDPRDAAAWLKRLGNPYEMVVPDQSGRYAIDLGVYGAPETFVIDKKGMIRYKYVGVIDYVSWQKHIKPVYEKLKAS